MKKEKAGQQGHAPAGGRHQPVPHTDRAGHRAKDGEHRGCVAELGSAAGLGQPWSGGVTWGPRSAQHALRPQQARPARAQDGAATGKQKQARPSETEALRGHRATFISLSWLKRSTGRPEPQWETTNRVNGQRPWRRSRIKPGLGLAWSPGQT